MLSVFLGVSFRDVFYIEDATKTLWFMLGILEGATVYHVVCRPGELSAPHRWKMLSLTWMSWSGLPQKTILVQQRCFLDDFCYRLEVAGPELEFVPRSAHRKLGRAERHNAAWRCI